MYKKGDIVVYKRQVCKIKDIVVDNDKEYYKLVPVNDESLTIDILSSNKSLLRKIVDKKRIEEIIKEIPNIEVIDNINDKLL